MDVYVFKHKNKKFKQIAFECSLPLLFWWMSVYKGNRQFRKYLIFENRTYFFFLDIIEIQGQNKITPLNFLQSTSQSMKRRNRMKKIDFIIQIIRVPTYYGPQTYNISVLYGCHIPLLSIMVKPMFAALCTTIMNFSLYTILYR